MAIGDRIHPDTGNARPPTVAPPQGAYYSVKDQPLPPPATYRSAGRRRGRSPCCCLLAWLCSILVTLVVVIGVACLVFWLVVRPKAPKFDVENVQINGLNATSATAPLNTDITFDIQARNPNKKIGIYYDDITVNVQANGQSIGDGTVPSFYQGHKNTTVIHGDLSSNGVILSSSTRELLGGSSSNSVPLYARVDLKARIKLGSWKSKNMKFKITCDLTVDLTVVNGSQLKKSHCKLKT